MSKWIDDDWICSFKPVLMGLDIGGGRTMDVEELSNGEGLVSIRNEKGHTVRGSGYGPGERDEVVERLLDEWEKDKAEKARSENNGQE